MRCSKDKIIFNEQYTPCVMWGGCGGGERQQSPCRQRQDSASMARSTQVTRRAIPNSIESKIRNVAQARIGRAVRRGSRLAWIALPFCF